MLPFTRAYQRIYITLICLLNLACLGFASQQVLTCEDAIESARLNNPNLGMLRKKCQAALQRSKGAGSLANPELEISPSLFGTGGSDSDAVLRQPLELSGSRQLRAKLARIDADQAHIELDKAVNNLNLETSKAYWNLVSAVSLSKLSTENLNYAQQLQKAVQRQVDAGAAPGARLIKASVELIQAQQAVDKAKSEVEMAKAHLNVLMGREPASPIGLLAEFKDRVNQQIDAKAQPERSEINEALARIERSKLESEAISQRMKPDVSFQVRKGAETDDIGFAVVATMAIFDWGGHRSEKRAARHEVEACAKDLEAVKALVALDIAQARTKLSAARQIVLDYDTGLLEKARKAAELSRKGFESGATSYLEVLEAQATLREVEGAYIEALNGLCAAEAELAWAYGLKPAEVKKS